MAATDGTDTTGESVAPRSPVRTWPERIGEVDKLALGALLLSLVLAAVDIYIVARHSEIEVRPPEQIVLYLDGETGDPDAELVAAVQLPMVNTAGQDHGDMLDDATLTIAQDATFALEAFLDVTFVASDQETQCDVGYRCVRKPLLFVRQDYNAVFDIPGGSASARYLSFTLNNAYCTGTDCSDFDTISSTLDAFPDTSSNIAINLSFVEDGSRTITCELEAMTVEIIQAIVDYGFIALDCRNGQATGAPWL